MSNRNESLVFFLALGALFLIMFASTGSMSFAQDENNLVGNALQTSDVQTIQTICTDPVAFDVCLREEQLCSQVADVECNLNCVSNHCL